MASPKGSATMASLTYLAQSIHEQNVAENRENLRLRLLDVIAEASDLIAQIDSLSKGD
jgi:hypothetical protein